MAGNDVISGCQRQGDIALLYGIPLIREPSDLDVFLSKTEGQTVFLMAYADWCPFCMGNVTCACYGSGQTESHMKRLARRIRDAESDGTTVNFRLAIIDCSAGDDEPIQDHFGSSIQQSIRAYPSGFIRFGDSSFEEDNSFRFNPDFLFDVLQGENPDPATYENQTTGACICNYRSYDVACSQDLDFLEASPLGEGNVDVDSDSEEPEPESRFRLPLIILGVTSVLLPVGFYVYNRFLKM